MELRKRILKAENNYIQAVQNYSLYNSNNNMKRITFCRATLNRLYNLAGYTYSMRIINSNCFGTEVL